MLRQSQRVLNLQLDRGCRLLVASFESSSLDRSQGGLPHPRWPPIVLFPTYGAVGTDLDPELGLDRPGRLRGFLLILPRQESS